MRDANGNNTATLLQLHVQLISNGVIELDRLEDLTVDLTGVGQYRVRSRDEVDVATITQVSMYATDPTDGSEVVRSTWNRVDVQ